MKWSSPLALFLVASWLVAWACRPIVAAHFYLEEPASWQEQNRLGDPQKVGPCGDEGPDRPTGEVTAFVSGQTITIRIRETIFHPGHYRVALATGDRSDLPPDPPVTAGRTDCGSVPIMDPPVFPVLADGVLAHTAPLRGEQTIEVRLPEDVTCDRCTLQITQWMTDHAAPCFYYHCADISIRAASVELDASVGAVDAGANLVDAGANRDAGRSIDASLRADGGAHADAARGSSAGTCACRADRVSGLPTTGSGLLVTAIVSILVARRQSRRMPRPPRA